MLGQSRHLERERLPVNEVRRILIVRNNKRIGNMYFLLPFVRQVQAMYPDAQVDLMIINSGQAGIFANLGLNKILVSEFAFVTALPFLRTLAKTREHVYDLLYMPHSSSSDTLICAFVHARNKIAFWGEETVGVFRHAIRMEPESPHAALSPLTLLNNSQGAAESGQPESGHPVDHRLVFSQAEIEAGNETVRALKDGASHCFAYFRGARGAKIIPDSTWLDIRARFDKAMQARGNDRVRWIEILSPDISAPLVPGTVTYQSADLRQLAAVLRATDVFLCADTGPLHLADAADARCVGLYNVTNPLHYGCLNEHSINVTDIDNLDASTILCRLLEKQPSNMTVQ